MIQFLKKVDRANLKQDGEELDIDELKKSIKWFKQFISKVDELGVDKLKSVPADLKKLSDVEEKSVFKKLNIMNWLKELVPLILINLLTKQIITLRSKIMNIKHLVLLT